MLTVLSQNFRLSKTSQSQHSSILYSQFHLCVANSSKILCVLGPLPRPGHQQALLEMAVTQLSTVAALQTTLLCEHKNRQLVF